MIVNNDNVLSFILPMYRYVEENSLDSFEKLGFRSGVLGLSLLNYALYTYGEDEEYKRKGDKIIESAFEKLNSGYIYPGLYRDLCDIGSFLSQMRLVGLEISGTDSILHEIDELLLPLLEEEIEKNNFDPVTGALCYGYYYLSRLNDKPELEHIVKRILLFLKEIAIRTDKGWYWESKLLKDNENYFGITHGTTNIVLFCVYAMEHGIEENVDNVIKEGLSYIRNSQLHDDLIVFPVIEGKSYKGSTYPKSYCYGDYSTLFGLMYGYKYLNDLNGYLYSLKTFRKIHELGYDHPYLDAGSSILYGTAGQAMLFNRMYEISNDEYILKAFDERIEKIKLQYNKDSQYLGYTGYWNQSIGSTNYSFSEGISGIITVLLSTSKKEIFKLFDALYFIRSPLSTKSKLDNEAQERS